MCVVSMIMDGKYDWWKDKYTQPLSPSLPVPYLPLPSIHELEEFWRLLERAREYDKQRGEAACEMEEKKQKLLKLAEELGIADNLKPILEETPTKTV